MIKCDECGKFFEIGNMENGLPNGVGFVLEDGRICNICSSCIMAMTPERAAEVAKKINAQGDRA